MFRIFLFFLGVLKEGEGFGVVGDGSKRVGMGTKSGRCRPRERIQHDEGNQERWDDIPKYVLSYFINWHTRLAWLA